MLGAFWLICTCRNIKHKFILTCIICICWKSFIYPQHTFSCWSKNTAFYQLERKEHTNIPCSTFSIFYLETKYLAQLQISCVHDKPPPPTEDLVIRVHDFMLCPPYKSELLKTLSVDMYISLYLWSNKGHSNNTLHQDFSLRKQAK